MPEEKYMEFMCVGCSEICLARLKDTPKLCLLKGANTYDLRVNWIRIDNLEPIDIAREIISIKLYEYYR